MIRQSRIFAAVAQRRGIDLGTVDITPPRILLKMWRVIQDLLEEAASDGRATFVPVAPETMDSAGFLAGEFWGFTGKEGDITHANSKYGRLMLEFGLQRLWERRPG
jgi:hypothetical protein